MQSHRVQPVARRDAASLGSPGVSLLLVCIAALLIGQFVLCAGVANAGAARPSFTILLSNDDGIAADGLRILHDALQQGATVLVAAPANERSGSGHGVTIQKPINVEAYRGPDGSTWHAVHATPATTVRLAVKTLIDRKPDLVVTGINHGRNVGVLTWTSGTVGAAREAALWGIPAVAVSQSGENLDDYKALARYVARLISTLRTQDLLKPGLLLNVNGPSGLASDPKGVRVVPLGPEQQSSSFEQVATEPNLQFRETWHPPKPDENGGDVAAHARGFITITPLVLDQTDTASLDTFAAILEADGSED